MKTSQGRQIIAVLKRKPMTSMDLQMLGISTCWWKRVRESLPDDECLQVCGRRRLSSGKEVNLYRVVHGRSLIR